MTVEIMHLLRSLVELVMENNRGSENCVDIIGRQEPEYTALYFLLTAHGTIIQIVFVLRPVDTHGSAV